MPSPNGSNDKTTTPVAVDELATKAVAIEQEIETLTTALNAKKDDLKNLFAAILASGKSAEEVLTMLGE